MRTLLLLYAYNDKNDYFKAQFSSSTTQKRGTQPFIRRYAHFSSFRFKIEHVYGAHKKKLIYIVEEWALDTVSPSEDKICYYEISEWNYKILKSCTSL